MRIYIAFILLVLFSAGLISSANSATVGKVGSGVRTILEEQDLAEHTLSSVNANSEYQLLQTPSATTQSLAVITLSDILGMYELVSCHVVFSYGGTADCNQFTFSGDMAITPHSTTWQRISFSGIQPIVASGLFTLSNNTLTLVNDLVVGTSVIPLTMDGSILTTRVTTVDGTETDVWRKIYGPSTPDLVNLSGTIKTPVGSSVCAMVLASGKFTFSCSPIGVFSLTGLTRDNDGTVTRQIYANGFFPKVDTLTDSSTDAVVMIPSGTCPNYNTPYYPAFVPGSAGKRINIAGRVLVQNSQTPICAIVLANGTHTFSCDGSGNYALNIPLDNNGQFKLQVYANGYAPTIQTFDEFKTTNNVRMARAEECQ